MAVAALAALLVAALAAQADAGCYHGRPHAPVKPEDYSWNYAAPVGEELQRHHLPKAFNWCSVQLGMCTPNLGQHQPIYCGACWVHGTLSMVRAVQSLLQLCNSAAVSAVHAAACKQSYSACMRVAASSGVTCGVVFALH